VEEDKLGEVIAKTEHALHESIPSDDEQTHLNYQTLVNSEDKDDSADDAFD